MCDDAAVTASVRHRSARRQDRPWPGRGAATDATEAGEARSTDGARPGRADRSTRVVWVLAGLAALPAVVAAVATVGVEWVPASDYAPIEVRVRDVASRHPPLVGAYSRIGGSHPGPALFVALAPLYRLTGGQPWSLLAGAALVNGAAMAGTVRILGRRGRVGLAAAGALVVLACAFGMGVEHLRDPWNPRIAVLPFLLAAVATWAVGRGSRRSLPVALVAASWCVQAHVGYALLVAVLVLGCGIGLWAHRRPLRAWRASLLLTVVLVGAMWAPPVGQQLLGSQGNLATIVTRAGGDDEPTHGWAGIESYLLPHLAAVPPWFRPVPEDPFDLRGRRGLGLPVPPLGLLALVAGTAVAARRRQHDALALAAVTGTLWLAGALSLSRLSGLPAPYLYRWVRPLGALLWLSALWPLATLVHQWWARRPGRWWRPSPAAGSLLAIALVGLVALGVSADQARTPPFQEYRATYEQTAVVAQRAVEAVRATTAPGALVEVRGQGAVVYVVPAVVAALERAGHPTLVDAGSGRVWGHHRLPGSGTPARIVTVTDLPTDEALAAHPAATLIAAVDQLTPPQRQELARLQGPGGPACNPTPPVISPACARLHHLRSSDRHLSLLLEPAG